MTIAQDMLDSILNGHDSATDPSNWLDIADKHAEAYAEAIRDAFGAEQAFYLIAAMANPIELTAINKLRIDLRKKLACVTLELANRHGKPEPAPNPDQEHIDADNAERAADINEVFRRG